MWIEEGNHPKGKGRARFLEERGSMWNKKEKIDPLKRWKYQTTLPASWETCMQGQEATVRTRSNSWKNGLVQNRERSTTGCILLFCLIKFYAEYIMWNARLDETQAGIKIARRNINNLRYADDTTVMAESEEELKSLLMKVKEESEEAGLKLNIQKTKITPSNSITSWQIDGETLETVTDFIFLGSKITADGDCSHEIKRCLFLGRKATTNLNNILKSRGYFADKCPSSQSYGFSSSHVWLWELVHKAGWALKN